MNFKKLIPTPLRKTRWGSFFEAIQNLTVDLKTDRFDPLKYKFKIENSGDRNLKDLVLNKGASLPIYEGYTSTTNYFRRRADNISKEILYRTASQSYQYILKSFLLQGNVYSLRKDSNSIFRVIRNPLESVNSDAVNFFLSDQESDIIFYFDEFGNPVPDPPLVTGLQPLFSDSEELPAENQIFFLDSNEVRDYTNHFVVEYTYLTIESLDIFATTNTSSAFYDTIIAAKRLKEIPHFQPKLYFDFNLDQTVVEREFLSFDRLLSSLQKTIASPSGDFRNVTKIQFGSGRNLDLDTVPVFSCSIPLETFALSAFNVLEQTATRLSVEYLTYEYSRLGGSATGASGTSDNVIVSFSELAWLTEDDQIVTYAYFPTVTYSPKMYTSVALDCTLI